MSIQEMAGWGCLIEIVGIIEEEADTRRIPEKSRWKLYKAPFIKHYMKERTPTMELELQKKIEREVEDKFFK